MDKKQGPKIIRKQSTTPKTPTWQRSEKKSRKPTK